MNKKLISLLVAICLVIGLLPVASIAEESEAATAKIAIMKNSEDHTLTVTEGGEPIYGKSVQFDGYKKSGTTYTPVGTGWKFTQEGASATDWNFKFEYPLGGVPTLTLNNAKLDQLSSSGSAMYVAKADGSGYESSGSWSLVSPRTEYHKIKVVLQGENVIRTSNGIVRGAPSDSNRFESVTIVGEAGSSLTGTGKAIGIQGKYGVPITIENANITLTSASTSNTAATVTAAAAIYTEDANITIKNSTLNLTSTSTKSAINAICANGTGTITVENSNLELTATSAVFNKAPTLSDGATIVAGDDATSAVTADAAALTTAMYAKVTYPAPTPSTEGTSAPTTQETTAATSAPTSAPTTEATTAPTTAPTTPSAGSTLATAVSVKVAGRTLTVNKYETAVYSKNSTSQQLDTTGTSFDVIGQAAGDENDWNTKFIWHVNDDFPTLYIDGLIIDDYNETTSKWKAYKQGTPTEGGNAHTTAIEVLAGQKVKLVFTGDDSLFKCRFGITFKSDLEIKSEGTTKLTVRNLNTGISSYNTACALTIDANLDMEATEYYTGNVNNAVIQNKGDIIINGGNITAITHAASQMYGIYARDDGDIIINGGNITANDVTGNSVTNAALTSNTGKVIINGGTVTPTSAYSLGLFGKTGIEINGGTVNINVPYRGMNSTEGQIAINGGTVEIISGSGAFIKEPVLGAGISGIVGPDATDVWAFRAGTTDYQNKYAKTGAGVADGAPTKPMPTTAPTTTPTTPGSGSTTAGTSAPTTAPTVPATYGDALATEPTIRMGYENYRLTHYDKPIYLVNSTRTAEDTDGQEFTNYLPTRTGANEDNYNLKFVWNTGDANPKVILRGFKWDQFNNETGKMASTFDTATNAYTGKGVQMYPLNLPLDIPIDIILTGEDSVIDAAFGILYQGPLSIKSEGTTKLIMNSMTGCIMAHGTAAEGDKLTIDANLDLTTHAYYNSTFGTAVIHTYKANMFINGGNISCKVTDSTMTTGLNARDGGNIIINGGKIVAQGNLGASQTTGAVNIPNGKLVINGGELEPVPTNNMGVYARWGIDINGGAVRGYSPMKGLRAGTTDDPQPINITGGLVEFISASGAFFDKPVLGEGITGYAGDNYKDVKTYDPEKDYSKKYVKIGVNVTEPNASNVPTLPGADPNVPGSNPSAPEVEPTVNPTAKPGMKLAKAVSVDVGGVKMRITKYDEPVYVVNTPVEYREQSTKDGDNVIEGSLFQGMTPTLTTDENNWNAKFVWPSTEPIPILYLNGLVIDDYNETTEKWRLYGNKPTDAAYTTGIAVPNGQYMKIIASGEDSVFHTRFGINFKSKLAIETVGDTKIDLWNLSATLYGGTGMPLVLNANMDIFLTNYYTGTVSQGIMTNQADITINGGNISIDFGYENYSSAIIARDSGNITINGGNITARGVVGTAAGNGTIKSEEKIFINGGTLNITALKATAMFAKKGIEFNGGVSNFTSPWYGINSGSKEEPGTINLNGGTVTVVAQNAVYTSPVIVVGEGMYAYAGAGPRTAEVFDGSSQKLAQKPWFFATDDESKKIVIEADEEEDLEDILDPTEAPTESTTAPTDATADPGATDATDATDATEATTPEEEIPEDEYLEDDNYYGVTPNLHISGEIGEDIPDALYDVGIDSADMIRDILVENIWAIDDYSDYFAFFEVTLLYHDGTDWVKAGEEHFPEDGYITVMLPYPEGTDIDTPFSAVHMFTSDAFGMTPGEVELLMPINTDEGILVELTGLSPVAIAWEGVENPPTGDTDVAIFFTMMLVSVLGMAATVVYSKKRKAQ